MKPTNYKRIYRMLHRCLNVPVLTPDMKLRMFTTARQEDWSQTPFIAHRIIDGRLERILPA